MKSSYNKKKKVLDYGDCQMSHCKRKAATLCREHKNTLWYIWALQFHPDCDVKIKNDYAYTILKL